MTIILFFGVLFILILVHEWGHFIVAKKTDMQVDEFGIGFPPKLFGIKKGETEYTFNALPIGGFVRIFGEDAITNGEVVDETNKEKYARSFVSKSKWAQVAVLIAGVTMNILFAWFLFIIVFAVGVPTLVSEEEASSAASLTVTQVMDESPAGLVGLPAGSKIVSVEADEITLDKLTPTSFREFTENHSSSELVIGYEEDNEVKKVSVQAEQGLVLGEPDRYAVGIALAMVEKVEKPILLAIKDGFTTTVSSLAAIAVGLGSLIADSVTGNADFSQVAGPIGIAGMVGDAAEFGITSLLMFTAVISLNLAVINLLPFPALDGGRLVFVIIESITKRPIKPVWVMRLNLLGFGLLMLLMVAVTYNDILRLL